MERSEIEVGGWFESLLARKAAHLDFYSSIIALTEPDVLDGIDPNLHRV